MAKKENSKSDRKAWPWVVTPILFLVVGAGVFFGLNYLLKKNPENQESPVGIVDSDAETTDTDAGEQDTSEAPVEENVGENTVVETEVGPSPVAGNPQNGNGTNSASTYDAVAHDVGGVKYVYYKTLTWGTVLADFEDFRNKVAETLNDSRGWVRGNFKFVEVSEGQDLNIVLSDAASLDGYNGYCSSTLSCTSGYNEVIINDERWREGTDVTTGAGMMSLRDYQNMVVNHEVGHWLGHYQHTEACSIDGGVAPIMLQQSTGLRNCGAFNPWPLDEELWSLR